MFVSFDTLWDDLVYTDLNINHSGHTYKHVKPSLFFLLLNCCFMSRLKKELAAAVEKESMMK